MISSVEISSVYHRYWINPLRVLGTLSSGIREQGLSFLRDKCGHTDIRFVLLDVLAVIPAKGIRPTHIADALGINVQYCLELLRELEAAGYVKKVEDDDDSRARKILRTASGNKLIRDCLRFGQRQDQLHLERISASRFKDMQKAFNKLITDLKLDVTNTTSSKHLHNTGCQLYEQMILIDMFVVDFQERHMSARGHAGVSETMNWIIGNLLPLGSTATTLAKEKGITSQAMGRAAREAEQMGYVTTISDEADKRRSKLVLTTKGFDYLRDAVDGINAVERQLEAVIGKDKLRHLFEGLDLLACESAAPVEKEISKSNLWLIDGTLHQTRSEKSPMTWEEMIVLLAYWSTAPDVSSKVQETIDSKRGVRQIMLNSSTLQRLANTQLDLNDLDLRLQEFSEATELRKFVKYCRQIK